MADRIRVTSVIGSTGPAKGLAPPQYSGGRRPVPAPARAGGPFPWLQGMLVFWPELRLLPKSSLAQAVGNTREIEGVRKSGSEPLIGPVLAAHGEGPVQWSPIAFLRISRWRPRPMSPDESVSQWL